MSCTTSATPAERSDRHHRGVSASPPGAKLQATGKCGPAPGAFRNAVPQADPLRYDLKSVSVESVTRYVIDASTLLHLVADGIQVNPAHQIVAPNGIRSQAMCLLLEAVRDGELTEELALQHHERLTELKMRLLCDRVSRRTAWKIAREHGWDTIYAAEYLAVTKLQADALVTVDESLAAKADGIVPLAGIKALIVDQR